MDLVRLFFPMPDRSVPYESLPGVSRLAADHARSFEAVSRYYELSPANPDSYVVSAGRIDYPAERRAALVDALAEQNPGNPGLETLAEPGTCVVATGQQVGLFLGPAYTIYKALTAARLAARLTERGIRTVPVFWMATEDHDFAEVNHCRVYGAGHRPVRIEAPGAAAQQPVGPVRVGGDPVAYLRHTLSELPFAEEVIDAVATAYTGGCTFGEGFRRLLERWLKPYGVLLLDPLHPAMRALAAPMLAEASARHTQLVRLVVERGRALEAAGYHAQVKVEEGGTLLFSLEGGRRVPIKGGVAPSRPEDLSPNALLRPVVQDFMMPTVAVVMGPAEVAYMAQAGALYKALLGRMPVVVNRAGFTLMDARCAKLMDRYGLALGDLRAGEQAVAERMAAALIPADLDRSLKAAASETGERMERLRTQLAAFDPTLAEAAARSTRKILHQMGKIERKAGREALRRAERAGEDSGRLTRLLYPERQMQERFYSILPFLAEYGTGLLDRLYERIDPGSADHQVLPL